MKRYSNLPRQVPFGVLVICLVLLTTGCGVISERTESWNRYSAEVKALEQGDHAFKEGDFKKALEIFQNLSRHAKDEVISCKALYGLACTRLVLAENQAELSEAIMLWNVWSQLVPKGKVVGDPRMLTPFLQQGMAASETAEKMEGDSSGIPAGETQDYKKLLQVKAREIERLRTEVHTLKQQINSLETIYQTIQEKKKELSSP